jgi:predicted small secreted protein
VEFTMSRSTIRAIIVTLVLATLAPVLSACNTTAGAGQDVSAAGRAVTNSADKVKSGL